MESKKDDDKRVGRFIKIPQTKGTIKANITLAFGLLLIMSGIFFLAEFIFSDHFLGLMPLLFFIAGAVCIYLALAFTQSSVFLFLGLLFALFGIATILLKSERVPYGIVELWPLYIICFGVALVPAGLYKLRRVKTIYLFPAIMLILMGVVFLLFSVPLVPFTFTSFIKAWWPLILILFGVGLIVLFFIQKAHAKDFPYMEDDSLVDGEDN